VGQRQLGATPTGAAQVRTAKEPVAKGRALRDHFHRISFNLVRICRHQMLAMQELGGISGYPLEAKNADHMPEKCLNLAREVGGGRVQSTK
jgi:hypothetical protein